MSVIINGGGLIGLFLAKFLAQLTRGDLEIFIVEKYSPEFYSSLRFDKHPNVIVLSKGAYTELMQVDINSALLAYSNSINNIEISEYTRFNKIFIRSKDFDLSELGYVVELEPIRKELFNVLSKESMVHIYCPARICKLYRKQSCNFVVLSNGKQIHSKLIIAADGSYSELASNCGVQWCHRHYQQTAVVTKIITEISHAGTAFERFTISGPLALLPMSNNVSCIIWCFSNQNKKIVSRWNTDQFIQELQSVFGWRLGKILNIKKQYFYDLCLVYAKRHISHRIALVGNAAQTLHPVAGQGLNLGIRDAVSLSQIICRSFYHNMDFGDYSVLEQYQQCRRLDQYKVIMLTDGLIRIFSNHCVPLVIARNLGLLCINYNNLLKKILVNSIVSWKLD